MLSLGIMSDTHGNSTLAFAAAERMRDEYGVEEILHLGDNYPDAEELFYAGYPVRMVPGLQCRAYFEGDKPNLIIDDFGEISVAMAHADHLFDPGLNRAQVYLHGHTHASRIELRFGAVWHNPGHLKARRDRGQDASFSIVRIGEETIHFAIIEVQGVLREEKRFVVDAQGALKIQ